MTAFISWLAHQPQWFALGVCALAGLAFLAAVFAVWVVGFMLVAVSRRDRKDG